jgi:hypothetical protein
VYVQDDHDATGFTRYFTVHFTMISRRENLLENAVDKVVGDGQNPYHSYRILMTSTCKHPIVKVVAREDDVEFVECQQCGEVFDSAEYSDIAIEEEALTDPDAED